ncbi:MAG: VWA domain-containing protein [Hyphomicrobium sp.]
MRVPAFVRHGFSRPGARDLDISESPRAAVTSGVRVAGSRFARDASGDVAMMFGLTAFATFMFVGAAVDMGRWLDARSHTIDAIDAAVLAAGRALQTGATEAAAMDIARQYYDNNIRTRAPIQDDTVSFEVRNNGTTVAATGSAFIKTPFMGLAKVERLPLFMASEAPEARTAQDASGTYNREVSLMLDVSGSMCSPCTKRDAMKAAAKDLVEIMMKYNGRSTYWSKIAVVPFSGDVRPPASILATVIDPASPADRTVGTKTSGGKRGTTTAVKYPIAPCVAERAGAEKASNAAPGPGNYVTAVYAEGGLCEVNAGAVMAPLSNNKTAVLASIDALQTGGRTAGHIGTAWAYYFLSPQWNSVIPSAGHASAFGTSKLKKIAVLMTDGEYNSEHDSNGVGENDTYFTTSVNGTNSAAQAVALCSEMKKSGIEVFTVGFDLPSTAALNTLKSCATDASKVYAVATGEQLKAAFRDIAIRLSELHLAK